MPKISALTSLAQADVVTTTDVLPIVDATAPATTKKVTVQAMVNAGLATLTTLPSGIVNASINSITPSGDVLDVIGHVIRVGRYGSGTGGNVRFVNDAGVQHWLAGILGSVGYRRYSIYDLPNAREILGIDATSGQVQLGYGLAVTGSISATGSIGVSNVGGTAEYPIDVIREEASAVSLRIRNVSASANAYSMVGVNASGNAWGMRMGSAAANSNALEWVLDAFSSPVVKMSLTTAGNLSVTGSISATQNSSGPAVDITQSGSGAALRAIVANGTQKLNITNNSSADFNVDLDVGLTTIGTSAGELALKTAGVERARLNSTGLSVTGSISATSYVEGAEQAAPAAPAANGYRIFAQDNGAGKTQLMVIFASGAAQQIAIEP